MKFPLSIWLLLIVASLTFVLSSFSIFLGDMSWDELVRIMMGQQTLDLEAWMGKPLRVITWAIPISIAMGVLAWMFGQIFEQPVRVKKKKPLPDEPQAEPGDASKAPSESTADSPAKQPAASKASDKNPTATTSEPATGEANTDVLPEPEAVS